MFGYVGWNYWPQYNNSIYPNQTIPYVASLSYDVGAQNLRLVGSVDVAPGHGVNHQVSTVASYVSQLRQYASVVYARVDSEQFYNCTCGNNVSQIDNRIYGNVSFLYNVLHVNGIFFDLAPYLYHYLGQLDFNKIMQNLTDSFPNLQILVNATSLLPTPAPFLHNSAYDWQNSTYVMPSPSVGSDTYSTLDLSKIAQLNVNYSGKVLVHFDAEAIGGPDKPMAVFANQTAPTEMYNLNILIANGVNPPSCPGSNCKYDMLIPVLGAWTATDSIYNGTLYNSFGFGKYERNTFDNFTQIIVANYVTSTALSAEYSQQFGYYLVLALLPIGVAIGECSVRKKSLQSCAVFDP